MTEQKENPMQKIISKCWEDEAFKREFISDPNKVLGDIGVSVPEGVKLRVVEDSPEVRTVVIPYWQRHLTDDDLANVTGGVNEWYCYIFLGCQ